MKRYRIAWPAVAYFNVTAVSEDEAVKKAEAHFTKRAQDSMPIESKWEDFWIIGAGVAEIADVWDEDG